MKNAKNLIVCAGVVASIASVAAAAPRDSITYTAVNSNGILGSAVNELRGPWSPPSVPYDVGRLTVNGSLTKVNSLTFASEARIQVTPPVGGAFTLQPFTTGSFTGTLTFTNTFTTPFLPPRPAAGDWNFRFYESLDDGGTGSVDATWDTITFTLDDQPVPPPTPPTAIDLGAIGPGTTINRVGDTLAASTPTWYRFTLNSDVKVADRTFLDIDTNGSVITGSLNNNDTEVALFKGLYGVVVSEDDEGGSGSASLLSYGRGNRIGLDNTSLDYRGQNGELLASDGTYYLAVSAFSATYGIGYGATSGTRAGTINLNITFGLQGCSPADFNNDGEIDFSDIESYLGVYNLGCLP